MERQPSARAHPRTRGKGIDMNWMQDVSKLLEQYNSAQPEQAPDTVDGDFDQVAQTAPQPAIADGLAAAFRSEKTPEFGQMASNLFTNSDSTQQAGLLNTILKYAGPAVLGAIMSRGGGNATGGGGGGL